MIAVGCLRRRRPIDRLSCSVVERPRRRRSRPGPGPANGTVPVARRFTCARIISAPARTARPPGHDPTELGAGIHQVHRRGRSPRQPGAEPHTAPVSTRLLQGRHSSPCSSFKRSTRRPPGETLACESSSWSHAVADRLGRSGLENGPSSHPRDIIRKRKLVRDSHDQRPDRDVIDHRFETLSQPCHDRVNLVVAQPTGQERQDRKVRPVPAAQRHTRP